MYRICIALFSVFISFSTSAQKYFQKGYFIDNEGTRTECYINDKEWSQDPKIFSYKLTEGKAMLGSIRTVREIGIGETRYLRFDVQVDKSSSNPDSIKENSSPQWTRDTLFLSVLVDSKADLFYCKRKGEDRFFFRVDDGPVTQLVHKLYRVPRGNTQEPRIATNNTYRNQLKNEVNCRGFSDERLKGLHYNIGVLITFFKQQNECWGSEVSSIDATDRGILHIKLTPGLSFAHAEGYAAGKKYQDYDPGTGLRLGADFEFSLPFHRKEWALLLEPAIQSYSSKGHVDEKLTVKYTSIELAMGLRYYFIRNKKTSIFINGAAVLDVPTEYLSSYQESSNRMETTSICAAAGLGGTFKRFSVEARYYTTRTTDGRADISTPNETIFIPLSNDYQKMSIIFGYRLF
ncbi:hypothetical protein [Chryseolinea sp. H1M3-3]|uniref:hypothetical protein n=1 Tax=Chryseolinea sp. H1M3-3 TaxID=3034144 RepID=UPI0023EC3BE3|nr:hypothetical protein [Chryseolinea sp. H1M3-3]